VIICGAASKKRERTPESERTGENWVSAWENEREHDFENNNRECIFEIMWLCLYFMYVLSHLPMGLYLSISQYMLSVVIERVCVCDKFCFYHLNPAMCVELIPVAALRLGSRENLRCYTFIFDAISFLWRLISLMECCRTYIDSSLSLSLSLWLFARRIRDDLEWQLVFPNPTHIHTILFLLSSVAFCNRISIDSPSSAHSIFILCC
jgi:hypothetical protein